MAGAHRSAFAVGVVICRLIAGARHDSSGAGTRDIMRSCRLAPVSMVFYVVFFSCCQLWFRNLFAREAVTHAFFVVFRASGPTGVGTMPMGSMGGFGGFGGF